MRDAGVGRKVLSQIHPVQYKRYLTPSHPSKDSFIHILESKLSEET